MATQRVHKAVSLAAMLALGCGGAAARQGTAPAPGMSDGATASDGGFDAVAAAADAGGPRRVPYRALAVAAGFSHTCVLLDDHNVKCWGQNFYGQLGLGDKRPWGALSAEMGDNLPVVDLGVGRRARAIAAGGDNTCAILDDGVLKCWGPAGRLGKPEFVFIGDEPGDMGDNLPVMELGAGRSARLVSLGMLMGCALLDDDTVKCWDSTPAPPRPVTLPSGSKVVDLAAAYSTMDALFDDGTVRVLHRDSMASTLVDLGGVRARSIAGSLERGCAALQTGPIMCWGFHLNPAMLNPDARGTILSVIGGGVCGVIEGGAIHCTGAQLPGDPTLLGSPAIALSNGGQSHGCALLEDQSVKCWGPMIVVDPDFPHPNYLGRSRPSATGWPAVDLGTRLIPGS